MNKRELFKKLNSLCIEMNNSYNINSGGCCFVAAVISEQLEKYNISFKIAYTSHPTHYAIKVSDRYINRDGFKFDKLFGIYSWNSEFLYETYQKEDWNDYYSKRWNLIVKTKIESLFKKYGNNI